MDVDPIEFTDMPLEVIGRVATFLDPVSLSMVGATCKMLHTESKATVYWKNFCESRNSHARVTYWNSDWRKTYCEHLKDQPAKQNRILVLQAAQKLSLWDPDLLEYVDIENFPGTLARLQPTWSWDGRYMASVSVVVNGSDAKYRIEILDVVSGTTRLYPVDRTPFFFSWHPDCTRLIYLSAAKSLVAAYLDIFETPTLNTAVTDSMSSDGTVDPYKDHTTTVYTGDAFYYCFSPLPGAERAIANVPGCRTVIVGFNGSMSSIPLSFQSSRRDRNVPQIGELIPTPLNFAPSSINPDPQNPLATAPLCYSQTPWWNSCNTMAVGLLNEQRLELVVAFDGLWNPKLENQTSLVDVWLREGSEGIQRLMKRHPMESHLKNGTFNLTPPGPIFTLFESKAKLSFVCSPNGRYIACYDSEHLRISEFLYDPPWTPSGKPTERYYERFHPRRLVGINIIYDAPSTAITVAFSPDNQSVLMLTRAETLFCWNTLKFVNGQNSQLVAYSTFIQSAFLMRHYIPFFSQYTQSMQLYSPDGSRFTYPADGQIFLQDVVETGTPPPPQKMCDGHFCAWSWQ